MKITENLGEFQKFIDNDNKAGLYLEDTIRIFDIQRIFGQFESVKQSGLRVTLILTTLLVILFYRSRNIHRYFSRQFGKQIEAVSKMHDHFTGRFLFGYKPLVCGYWDGDNFTLISLGQCRF